MDKANELITGLLSEPLENTDEALQHWGILGMKWGIRRFQNKDGSLTPEGKLRYAREQEKKELKWRIKKEKSENSFALRRLRAKLGKQIRKHKINTPTETYTDDELKALRWRLGLEKDVKELNGQSDIERDKRYNSARNKEFFRTVGEKAVDTSGNLLTSAGKIVETKYKIAEARAKAIWGLGSKIIGGAADIQIERGKRAATKKTPDEIRDKQHEREQQTQQLVAKASLAQARFNALRQQHDNDVWWEEQKEKRYQRKQNKNNP